ncbi:MAG: SAM-dependent methyltransferase [Zoogloeaceae bacterium]|jgi:SAM-dependent MidA family methyltransferase|nr:SAM-dependent methyltransferase [Zoogloeaceae bacterium]
MRTLPLPSPSAQARSTRLEAEILRRIDAAGGWISFADYMDAALYAPGLGYYAADMQKFGAHGDFITAPELTPLFATALARQAAEIMQMSAPAILEFGAGSGRLAVDLLLALEACAVLPERYAILEVSADLRRRQEALLQQHAPHLAARVAWLVRPPETFSGLVLANEVLDAMPVHCVVWREDGIREKGVAAESGRFLWRERLARGRLMAVARKLVPNLPHALPPDFTSEISLVAPAWVAAWGKRLARGALLLLDYGFPRREFYHPQRATGTLMCHYRHHAHPDPFYLPGLQDITAHVDFTALAEAAFDAGLDVLGYTDQARFLVNCGILEALATARALGARPCVEASAAVQTLILPQEMGELFKVIAFGKGIASPLGGFRQGDRTHAL